MCDDPSKYISSDCSHLTEAIAIGLLQGPFVDTICYGPDGRVLNVDLTALCLPQCGYLNSIFYSFVLINQNVVMMAEASIGGAVLKICLLAGMVCT